MQNRVDVDIMRQPAVGAVTINLDFGEEDCAVGWSRCCCSAVP